MKETEKKKSSKTFKYSGVFVADKTIGTNNPKKYKKGDTFRTDNQSVYQSLINSKIIKE